MIKDDKAVMLVCLLLYPKTGVSFKGGNVVSSLSPLAIDPDLKTSTDIPVKEDEGLCAKQEIVQNNNVLAQWNA